jgi:hypothetical protein
MSSEKRPFGPFVDVPAADIRDVGFICYGCRNPVERLAKVLPAMVPRMIFYACACGCVVTWEDENQPKDSRIWRLNIELLKSTGTKVVFFNGNRPLAPDFSGTN